MKKEEKYQITFKGLLSLTVDIDTAETLCREIELFGFRNDKNAILIDSNGFSFIKVELKNKRRAK